MKLKQLLFIAALAVVVIAAVLMAGLAIGGVFDQAAPTILGASTVITGALLVVLQSLQWLRHDRQSRRLQGMLARVADAESRHDFHRKLQLEQLEQAIARVRSMAEGINGHLTEHTSIPELPFDPSSPLPRVLFVTSNGAGMGHLTRCLAVARSGRERFQAHFVSLSSSAEVVRRFGYSVIKFPSHGQAGGISQTEWNNRFAEFFDSVCRVNKPSAVVFDGTWIYRGIHEATRRHGIQLVWLRRGLWVTGASTLQVGDRASIVDHLLVPRDIADNVDQGPVATPEGIVVPAPTLTSPAEVLTRDEALSAMGLDPDRQFVLVQLGAGSINNIQSLREDVIAYLLASSPNMNVVVGLSPLSEGFSDQRDRVHVVREYPLAPLFSAFEFIVIAAGYNSIHESVRFEVPAVVIPNLSAVTDNQALRAEEYAGLGFGLAAQSDSDLHPCLDRMLVRSNRERFREQLKAAAVHIDSGEGAAEALGDWLVKDD